jgi:hypothetical protein
MDVVDLPVSLGGRVKDYIGSSQRRRAALPPLCARELMRGSLVTAFCGLLLLGCASASVIPLSADTIEINTTAAPVCSTAGARYAGFRRAAIETINRGFDRFVIFPDAPVRKSGNPFDPPSHKQRLLVQMFHESDPEAKGAMSARATLGEDWQEIVTRNPITC